MLSLSRILSLALLAGNAAPLLAQHAPEQVSEQAPKQAPEQAPKSDSSGAALPPASPPATSIPATSIIVTGTALPDAPSLGAYSVVELDRPLIDSSASGRIEDVLKNVAGFQQFRRSDSRSANASAQGVTLRALGGNASSRALVLLDGVPMGDPFFGYIPLSAISPERLGTVRVTRGGGSGPFGAGALTGTIELASDNTERGLAARAFVNQRGESEVLAGYSARLGSGFASIAGRWDRGRGFFTAPQNERVPASARARFDSWSGSMRAVAPLSDTVELQARMLAFEDRRRLRFDGARAHIEGQDASVRLIGRGDWQFDALGYVQARNFSNIVISSTRFVRVLDQRNTPSTGFGGKLELRPPVGLAHTLRLGFDYRRSEGELQEEAYSAFSGNLRERRRGGGAQSDLGVFVEDDWSLGALLLTAGARADRTVISDGFYRAVDASGALVNETRAPRRADWSLSWRAGASLSPSDNWRLRAAAYRGFRLPTLNELYRPFVVFPVVTRANAALKNERLEGFEAGVDLLPLEGFTLSLTAFDNRIKDAIANVTLAPNLRQRQNLPAIKAQGVEANLNAQMGAVRFDGSLSFSDAKISDARSATGASLALNGNRPPQVPEFAASARLAFTPRSGGQLAATLRHVGAQFEDDFETHILSAATTLDLYAEVPFAGRFMLTLRGENVWNEEIVTRNTGSAIDLGAPRTLWLGLKLRN